MWQLNVSVLEASGEGTFTQTLGTAPVATNGGSGVFYVNPVPTQNLTRGLAQTFAI